MDPAPERIRSFAMSLRVRNGKRIQSSAIISILLAALLWRTQWPSLRLGLMVLLVAYGGSSIWLLYRNAQLSRDLEALEEGLFDKAKVPSWFAREESFIRRLMYFENVSRTAGFMVLGYGFRVATGSLVIAVLLGLVYPAITYFGLERKAYQRRMRTLRDARAALQIS